MEQLSNPALSLAMLESLYQTRYLDFMKLSHEQDKKTEAAAAKSDCDQILKAIGERATKSNVSTASATTSLDFKQMQSHFNDVIPTFCPTNDVILFVKELEKCFKLYVTRENGLESTFCRQIATKLNSDYSAAFVNLDENSRDSFDKCKKWLLENFSTKETIFQILDGLTEMEMKSTEDLQTFAARCQDKAAEIETRVSAMFKSKHNNTDMTVKDVFELFASMRVYNHLRNNENDTFKMVARELDECFVPTDISQKARVYMDRIKSTEAPIEAEPTFKVVFSRKRSANDCFTFKKHGECKRGDKCRYKHDPKYAKKKKTESTKTRESPSKRVVYLSKADLDRLVKQQEQEENADRQVFLGDGNQDSVASNESSVFQQD